MKKDSQSEANNDDLYQLELALLIPSVRQSRDQNQITQLIADDFREFGSTGKVYNKDDILEHFSTDQPEHENFVVEDFNTSELAEKVVLATYKVIYGAQQSLHTTIWKHDGSNWQATFHQGTNCPTKSKL